MTTALRWGATSLMMNHSATTISNTSIGSHMMSNTRPLPRNSESWTGRRTPAEPRRSHPASERHWDHPAAQQQQVTEQRAAHGEGHCGNDHVSGPHLHKECGESVRPGRVRGSVTDQRALLG